MKDLLEPSIAPKYEAPPVNELGFELRFRPLEQLTMAEIGAYWGLVRQQFPLTEDLSPIGPTEQLRLINGLPFPRVWLLDVEKVTLLQIQFNRFHLNWRDVERKSAYPGFSALLPKYLDALSKFANFVKAESGEDLVIEEVGILKTSLLLRGKEWQDPASIHRTLPFLRQPEIPGAKAEGPFAARFHMEFEDSKLRLDLKYARLASEKNQEILSLEIRSTIPRLVGEVVDMESIEGALVTANQRANLAFTSLVDTEVQKNVWRRTR